MSTQEIIDQIKEAKSEKELHLAGNDMRANIEKVSKEDRDKILLVFQQKIYEND